MGRNNRPLIAIVGSADSTRTYTEKAPLRNADRASTAAKQLGSELAEQGYRMMVYSRDPSFIEASFVKGYASSAKAKPNSIQIRCDLPKQGKTDPRFPEEQGNTKRLFDLQPYPTDGWEIPFYKSLAEADGAIFLGGGRSTYISGLFALANRLPLIALADFGGQAQRIYSLLPSHDSLLEKDDINMMGQDFDNDGELAKKLVSCLGKQRKRKLKSEVNKIQRQNSKDTLSAIVGAAALLSSVAMMILAIFFAQLTLPMLFIVPMTGGIAGALARNLLPAHKPSAPEKSYSMPSAIFLGMIVGLTTALAFFISHISTSTADLTTTDLRQVIAMQKLIIFELIISVAAGLALERTLRKIRSTDVAQHLDALGVSSEQSE